MRIFDTSHGIQCIRVSLPPVDGATFLLLCPQPHNCSGEVQVDDEVSCPPHHSSADQPWLLRVEVVKRLLSDGVRMFLTSFHSIVLMGRIICECNVASFGTKNVRNNSRILCFVVAVRAVVNSLCLNSDMPYHPSHEVLHIPDIANESFKARDELHLPMPKFSNNLCTDYNRQKDNVILPSTKGLSYP